MYMYSTVHVQYMYCTCTVHCTVHMQCSVHVQCTCVWFVYGVCVCVYGITVTIAMDWVV